MLNTLEQLNTAMKNLESSEKFKYLPSFECCGTCANARLYGYMDLPRDSEFEGLEFFLTFNEQAADRASDSSILYAHLGTFEREIDESVYVEKVKQALVSSGLTEVFDLVEHRYNLTDNYWNGFFVQDTLFVIYGNFLGLAPEYQDEDDWDDDPYNNE